MKSLEEIKGRCYIDEDGHWLWRGSLRRTGRANIYAPDYTLGGMKVQPGPRAVWHCHTMAPIPEGWRVYGTCEELACCNPAHTRCTSTTAMGKYISKKGDWKGKTKRILANRETLKKRTKMTPEIIAYIQSSPAKGVDLARELAVSHSTISKARRGEVIIYKAVGGMFAGLGAR